MLNKIWSDLEYISDLSVVPRMTMVDWLVACVLSLAVLTSTMAFACISPFFPLEVNYTIKHILS